VISLGVAALIGLASCAGRVEALWPDFDDPPEGMLIDDLRSPRSEFTLVTGDRL